MSLQVCHCGWSSMTTYQGLRIHQGMNGCTPKGMRIPERELFGSLPAITMGPPIKLEEPVKDIFNTSVKTGESLQVCHCGWSSVTTYHGLRTHQGMMGCTPKGMRIPERELFGSLPAITMGPPIKLEEPVKDIFNTSVKTGESLQVCHCGWSSVTTYQGLRIHQGMNGCTPKGMRIPERELFGSLPAITMGPPIKLEEPVKDIFNTSVKTDSSSDESLQVCHCGWSSVTTYHGLRTHQGMMGCTPKGMRIPESEQDVWRKQWDQSHQTDSRPITSTTVKEEPLLMPAVQTLTTQMSPAASETTLKEINKQVFETPQRSHQSATSSNKACRALDFSTGAQQVEKVWELPTTTAQETVICPQESEKEKEREAQKLLKARQDRMKADLQQKIHIREHKVTEVRSSVVACKASLDAEWLEINNVFVEVMKVVKDARQRALQPLEERRQKVKREAQVLVQKLQQEIDMLKKTIDDLEKNPDLQDSPLQGLHQSIDWKNVSVDTSFSFGTLKTTTSTMMKQIQQKLEKLSSVELKRIPAFAVDVKLDPTTAHQCLVLSDDGKKVRDGAKKLQIPNAPGRFDMFGSVLGLNSLTSGKSYWEVEVSKKTGWDLGVARRDANRKGKLTLNPDNGYWVTVHYEGKKYAALTAPPVSLSLKKKPQKVGVFVDYEEGLVSFYDVTTQSHIYSFTECLFGDEIFPYFSPHLKQNETNADPLTISAVKKQ